MRLGNWGRAQCAVLVLIANGCGLIGGDDVQPSPGAGTAAGSGGSGASVGGRNAAGNQSSSGTGAGAGAGGNSGLHAGGSSASSGLGPAGGSGAGSLAGASSSGGSPPMDPGCASAVNFEGHLTTSEISPPGKLVANVLGDLTIDSTSNGLADLRCLQTVSGYVAIQLASGGLSALGRLRSVGTTLKIEGNATIRNLSDLHSLGAVGDSLIVSKNSALVDLTGSLLGYVGVGISILENPALVNVNGLERLDGSPQLKVIDNVSLQSLGALSNMTRHGVDLEIHGNLALPSLTGLGGLDAPRSFVIHHQPLLRDLQGLERWTGIDRAVIDSNDALASLAGLDGVIKINSLTLTNNRSLHDLSGLERVQTLFDAQIFGNSQLENIDALGTSLVTVSNFTLEGPALTSVEGLHQALDFNELRIGSSGVSTLNGLRNMRTAISVTIEDTKIKDLTGLGKVGLSNLIVGGNAELVSLVGLSSNNPELQGLSITHNPKLQDLSGLSMVRIAQNLVLESDAALTSLTGLENLKTLASIDLVNLPVLPSLAPLAALKTIDYGAYIRQNPMLSNCEIQQFVTRCGAKSVDIGDNGPCN